MLLSYTIKKNKMASFVPPSTLEIKDTIYSVCERQKDENGQDIVKIIHDGETTWLVVIDGHGKHRYGTLPAGKIDMITWLRTTFNWEELFKEINPENPISELHFAIINEYDCTSGIGACCTIAKVTENKITMWWVGDSTMKVYADKELVAETRKILNTDSDEITRQSEHNLKINVEKTHNIKVLNETDLTMVESKYYLVKTSRGVDKVAVIQSLGHDLAYGLSNNKIEVELERGKKYKLVGASDGLWDMISNTESDAAMVTDENYDAVALVELASQRWEQEWIYVWNDERTPGQKIPNPDDICCVTLCKNI